MRQGLDRLVVVSMVKVLRLKKREDDSRYQVMFIEI